MVPKVSVVLLNWNGWKDTVNCIHSLEALDYPNFDRIVVDNGSDNDSVEQIRLVCPETKLIETGVNLGFGGGYNVGIRFALEHGADYVWILNNDTIVDQGALKALVEAAERDRKIGVVGSVLFDYDQPSRVQAFGGGRVRKWLGITSHADKKTTHQRLDYIMGASMLIRERVWREIGLFDDRNFFLYWEDTDICFRIRQGGWLLAVASDSNIWHKESASLGKVSMTRDFYSSLSAVVFFRRYATVPAIPILAGLGIRLLMRLSHGDFQRAAAVWKGFRQGLAKVIE